MKEPDYTRSLNVPGERVTDRIRIRFRQNKGNVEYFIVQYHALINGRWRSIMRIDTCHGYPHKHTFYLNGSQHISKILGDLNNGFTQASIFVSKDFKKIKENFMRGH